MMSEEFLSLDHCGLRQEIVSLRGQDFIVKELSCADMDKMEKLWREHGSLRVGLLFSCVYDEDENKFFKRSDIPCLLTASNRLLAPLATAALRVNGFLEEPEDDENKKK